MDSPITQLYVVPSYGFGFRYVWELLPTFSAAAPWEFYVEQGETAEGPWTALSPMLVNVGSWLDERRRVAPLDPTLYFRVRMQAGGKMYTSAVIMPYGELNRREYLLLQEMQRKELLVQSGMQGVHGWMWSRAIWGPVCTTCRDFVTGDVLTQNCPDCFNVGRRPGYHGPYPVWLTFSPAKRAKDASPEHSQTIEPYTFSIRTIGAPRLKRMDLLVDASSDKRYHIGDVTDVVELRRIPAIQEVSARELPISNIEYKLVTPR